MGSGAWNASTYSATQASLKASGRSTFGYTDNDLRNKPRSEWKAHENLDVHGVKLRESRDSDEHPTSLAISVLFDVTGSMTSIPRTFQTKLPDLFGLLMRKGYVEHPQVMFGGIGDAVSDRVPIQIGQWESDNRTDDMLSNILLEGAGGGQKFESYELSMYFMARHTSMDCLEKRDQKGYLFMLGDEMARDVSKDAVAQFIGDDGLEADIPLEEIVAELQEKFEVYFIIPTAASHGNDPEIREFWQNLFGERVLFLDDADLVCETIATAIGINEGTVDLSTAAEHLREQGSSETAIATVSSAVANVTKNAVARGTGNLPSANVNGSDVDRL